MYNRNWNLSAGLMRDSWKQNMYYLSTIMKNIFKMNSTKTLKNRKSEYA
jgi:hypothetical protein